MSLLSSAFVSSGTDGGGGGGGDIWSTGAFSHESPLKDLLDSNQYTTEDLLAQDELLQELRGMHPILTRYFGTEHAVTKLLYYVVHGGSNVYNSNNNTTSSSSHSSPHGHDKTLWLTNYLSNKATGTLPPAPVDDPMLQQVRFPYMSCEILCCELPCTIDTLVEGYVDKAVHPGISDTDSPPLQSEQAQTDQPTTEHANDTPVRLLDFLFSVLHETPVGELDDYRAGYLDKILTVLWRRRPETMTEYMNSGGIYGPEKSMQALLQHMYSYSITQIAQRLLLPPRPKPATPAPVNNTAAEREEEQDDDVAVGQDILGGEDDNDQDPDMNGAGVKCDWYKSKQAVYWLLDLLQGNPLTITNDNNNNDNNTSSLSTEQRLAMSINASEVFITVIQNSMLSSEIMLTLTSAQVWETLLHAVLPDPEAPFSSHESFQTSAMNVIESLVLQLGGYGAVGTMSLLPEGGGDGTGGEGEANAGVDEEAQHQQEHELIADLDYLLQVLPDLLQAFKQLLTHPSTQEWKSKMQFSQHKPVALLGMSRLKIVRVLESLVLLGDPDVDHCLVASDCLRICLDLFWQFQWCSMLHQSVANLLVHVFEGQNIRLEIQEYFLVQCNLLARLMDSFGKAEHVIEEAKSANSQKNNNANATGSSVSNVPDDYALTDSADPLPVSEEDIEAAMEVSDAVGGALLSAASTATSSKGEPAVAQSFRFGYMGHVIIISQALVQACAPEWPASGDSMMDSTTGGLGGPATGLSAQLQPSFLAGIPNSDSTVKTGETSEMEPLMIAELVKNHTLSEQWKEFVATSLASEIAIQSAQLGGYSGGPMTDPLASHRAGMDFPPSGARRPGLADDDMDMGSAAPQPPRPRGMLGGVEIIDMDDNDLDVAASMMMTDFGLGRPNTTATPMDQDSDSASGEFSGSGDSEKSYNSGETNNEAGGYLFDDPLGKSGGLGIELGKLTKLGPGKKKKFIPMQKSVKEDGDDDGSNSSSDESPPRKESSDEEDNNSTGDDDDNDVPVMDLFAGNFNHGQTSPGDEKPFDFANFDAFPEIPAPPIESTTHSTDNSEENVTLFAKAPPPSVDDDGFGDFVSADDAKLHAGNENPFADVAATLGDPFAGSVETGLKPSPEAAEGITSAEAEAVFAFEAFESSNDDDLIASGSKIAEVSAEWKSSFTERTFDDFDDVKPAPSDELAADAVTSQDGTDANMTVPKSEEDSGTEAVVLVSSS